MKLGFIQMLVTEDKEGNLRTAAKEVEKARGKGASLVVLPEMFLCPYENECFPVYAEAAGGSAWQRLAEMARENQVTLVGGSMPELDEGKLYNTSFIFDADGKQIGRHRKMHLFDIQVEGGQSFRESDILTAGNEVTVVTSGGLTFGVCICFDMRFPELARLMALKGAEMLIVPGAFNMTTGPRHWELMLRQRAVDNQLFTVGVAPARDEQANYISYGNSMIASPWGEVICRLDGQGETMVAELDLAEVKQVRSQLPLLSARRQDVYELKLKERLK